VSVIGDRRRSGENLRTGALERSILSENVEEWFSEMRRVSFVERLELRVGERSEKKGEISISILCTKEPR